MTDMFCFYFPPPFIFSIRIMSYFVTVINYSPIKWIVTLLVGSSHHIRITIAKECESPFYKTNYIKGFNNMSSTWSSDNSCPISMEGFVR